MTVAINQAAVLPYIGNGTASVFPITFPTFEASNVEASVADANGNTTDLVVDVDFTLASIGRPNTNGSLTLVDAAQAWLTLGKLSTGWTLYVKFTADAHQPLKGRDWGAFAPERFERTLDRLTMSVLAVKEIAGRALGLQLGDGASASLPVLTGNGGKILQVKTDETGFEYGVTSAQIQDWKDEALLYRNQAEAFKIQSSQDATDAEAAETGALAAQSAAATSATSAFNSSTAAATSATGAATSQANAAQSVTDANTAKNAAVVAQGLAEAARDAAIIAANDTSMVETYKIATEAARDLTLTYRDTTLGYRNETLTFRNEAVTAANDAETAMTGAETAMGLADIYAGEAEQSSNDAELFSNLQLYAKKLNITFADSPFTVDDDLHENTLLIVDDSGGNVVINLPLISDTSDQIGWKVGLMKKLASGNKITVNRAGTNTISGNTFVDIEDPALGLLLYANSPTDWASKFFLSVIAQDGFVLSGAALNFGDPGVDGTWRIRQDGTQLKFENRQLGAWVESDVFNP